jgi:hypothetical protein
MPAALIALALLGGALELDPDGGFGFDRVDILSEDPGTWLHYDLPYAGTYPTAPAIRFIAQVKPVWRTPVRGLYVGTSLASQSAVLERPVFLTDCHGLYWSAGLQTRLLLPAGLMGGVAWRYGPLRVGAGLSLVSTASWRHRNWTQWSALPTVGIGIGRRYQAPDF